MMAIILAEEGIVPEAKGRWKDACLVFDERVALGHGLAEQTVKPAGGDDD